MRLPRVIFFLALFSPVLFAPAFAQRGGGHGGGGAARAGGFNGGGARAGGFGGGSRMSGFAGGGATGGFRSGFGGGAFRGGGSAGGFRNGFTGGGFRGGFGRGFGDGRFRDGFRSRVFFGFGGYWGDPYWGWGYPFYGYGGYPPAYAYSPTYYDPYYYGSYDYGYGYAAQPSYTAPPPPQLIYSQPSPGPTNQSFYRTPDFYLIAFTDDTIQTALSFSVDGDTFHWKTREHVGRQAPLSTVDRRFSEQLNRERSVDLKLP